MSKRRVLIVLLFLLIGTMAVSRIVLQEKELRNDRTEEDSAGYWQRIGEQIQLPERDTFRQRCGILLDRLLILSVTVPFLITALLLLKNAIQEK